jgi:hypothetical protein
MFSFKKNEKFISSILYRVIFANNSDYKIQFENGNLHFFSVRSTRNSSLQFLPVMPWGDSS